MSRSTPTVLRRQRRSIDFVGTTAWCYSTLAQMGHDAAIVEGAHPRPGHVSVTVAIGWRAWVPWLRRRVRDRASDRLLAGLAAGVELHVHVVRKLEVPT